VKQENFVRLSATLSQANVCLMCDIEVSRQATRAIIVVVLALLVGALGSCFCRKIGVLNARYLLGDCIIESRIYSVTSIEVRDDDGDDGYTRGVIVVA